MAVCQSEYLVLTHRHREQAPSHIFDRRQALEGLGRGRIDHPCQA